MSVTVNQTNTDLIDELLVIVNKVRVILIAAKDFYGNDVNEVSKDKDQEQIWPAEAPHHKEFPASLVRPRRTRKAPRARITDQVEEAIIDALFNRDVVVRLQDVANEFGCSQSTVRRIKRSYEEALTIKVPEENGEVA